MKNICLLLLFIIAGFVARAQEPVKIIKTISTQRFKVDTNSVVKDSLGKSYTFNEWNELTSTGKYFLWPDDLKNANTSFTLVKRGSKLPKHRPAVNTGSTAEAAQKNLSPEAPEEQRMESYPKPMESENFTIGEKMALFTTHDMNGNKIKLKDLRGKVVMINFWFIGCPPCRAEIPELNKLVELYKDNPNVVFLAIALDSQHDLKKFLQTTPFNFAIIDDGRFLANMYNIRLYPTSVILDKEGKVAFHTVSFAASSPYWVKKTINEALK